MVKEIKIVFAGLEQGGKTSIIRTLERKKYVVEELKPTKGIERCQINVLDYVINEWDFGGQAEFRKQYLEKKEMFYDTDLLFFVIDILDTEKFSDAINYYKNILEILREHDPKPPIVILLHKCEKTEEIQDEKIKELRDLILSDSNGFEVEFFKTTIYESQTLMNAFSHGINRISDKANELSEQLKELSVETFADALVLIESNGFILGEYTRDEESRKMVMFIYDYLIGPISYMYKNLQSGEKPERILFDWKNKGYAFLDSTKIGDFEFFFIKYSKNPRKIVQKFVLRSMLRSSEQIKGIIKAYFG